MSSQENKECLPPPPPIVPPNVKPIKIEQEHLKKKLPTKAPMARRGLGTKGAKLPLLTNHFEVNVANTNRVFFQYSVALFYEDGRPVEGKGAGRKIIDKVQETYDSELNGKDLAYDGETLFTIGSLAQKKLEFIVVVEDVASNRNNANTSPDKKRIRKSYRSKTYKVEINFAKEIPLQAIANALKGHEAENYQEAIRVLDIILRQHSAKQGCLLVRQNFFHNDPNNLNDVGGGVLSCKGLHSSFRTTQSGLSLNIDVSTTMIVRPGPVVDFLIENQNVRDPFSLDWNKAKRTLKNLRITAKPSNQEYKITGLSELSCKDQLFTMKKRGAVAGEDDTEEITVYDYFVHRRKIDLQYSAGLPCINVGKPKRPTYIPIELCSLISLQRYTKALSTSQRSSLVEKSRQKPVERMRVLSNALKASNYGSEPMLRNCGISITSEFTQVDGRVLQAPRLKFGNEDFNPRNGRWNFNNKKFVEPVSLGNWSVVNFSARCDVRGLVRDLIKCGGMKGILVEQPKDVIEENRQFKGEPPVFRVEKMFADVLKLSKRPSFLLCLLPERKNSDLYGPWKKKNLAEFGIVTQCIAPTRVNDQYLTNVLLKINAKLGGMNSWLGVEHSRSIPIVSKVPTLILGMDVSHGSPGQPDIPSIAAVVSSRKWPLISKYRACVRTQGSKVEMIDNLFKPVSDKEDEGIIRELLLDFFHSSEERRPENIIIFRDGVSESQFNEVLNVELSQIIEACKFLDENWNPKFMVIVAQKNHHTKFFQPRSPDNVPPGTVVDSKICHPRNYDFYMCAHAGMIGTSRPTHYHVLLDEIGFSPDDLQELVHSLSYVYQRSTTAISVVAPICYAHLAASQVGQFMKFEDKSETSSSQGGINASLIPQLPNLHKRVCNSMFFV
ncbi:putative post-transcriptional gene silencing PAZ-Argonaute family protein [Medicago truncatula]|uniref:Eukaryotic translation initiation factor 2c, putative n=1 Tax=Medicago truncatula TaxID=3880 RepID=G7K2Z2_MEDTR|nr:protein argonaute 4 [Medicago truncatula]XP_039690026.1 protein argonaute 4 [Medicago truncatula]AET00057.2 eukaryotic translation initiation factor 2c, putative [Medicago truncatula]RHN57461.1 putative post-transcriptional gene silencing PAZ-Argonaute family protein [Medicago truncatula]